MKKLLFSLIILSIAAPAFNQQMDKVDSVILECMEKHYAIHHIDLNEALDSIEFQLIKQEAINSADSAGINAFYQGIADGKDVTRVDYTPIMDSVTTHYHFRGNLRDCIMDHPEVDFLIFENSNYVKNQVELTNKANELGGVNPTNAAKAMLIVYCADDFSTELFRAHFLLSVLVTAYEDKSYLRSTK